MADARRYALTPQLDIQQILIEAKSRWLRPSEICEILRNYQRFSLTPDPPYKPQGGSLFLFDRKALRYFRKDGHHWRKKKDGKTVREAHEKLKSGSVDVLHCYYAHGEDNENFQRRSYWMLDGQLEHIVLVHYRDVNEGSRSSIPHMLNTDFVDNTHVAQPSSAVCSHLSSAFATRASNASSPSTADRNGSTPSSEFDDADSGDDFSGVSVADSMSCSRFQIASLPGNGILANNVASCSGSFSHHYASGLLDTSSLSRPFSPLLANQVASQNLLLSEDPQKMCGASQPSGSFGATHFGHHIASSTWPEVLSLSRKLAELPEQNISFGQPNCHVFLPDRLENSVPDVCEVVKYDIDGEPKVLTNAHPQSFLPDDSTLLQVEKENSEKVHSPFNNNRTEDDSSRTCKVAHEHEFYISPQFKCNSGARMNAASINQPLECKTEVSHSSKNAMGSDTNNDELGELKKLDSFGRWMNKEIGKDCDDSLMASDSCNYWNALDTQSDEKEVSSLSRHMQLDIDSLGPSLSQEQLFSIIEFSPDWAYSGTETKILISGTFLGSIERNSIKWCCMFGEQEVSAEILATNVIRCQAPPHAPGRVPFYITCSNRLACSEVREFEYRKNLTDTTLSLALKSEPEEEVHLQVRFAKMLSLGVDRKRRVCSVEQCKKCKLKNSFVSLLSDDENEWEKIEKNSEVIRGYDMNHKNILLQKLLKDKLYEWLVCKVHEEGKGPNILDEEGQGAIHLAAALGYEWAMSPIVAAGVHPSFRDAHGRTALHWAAYFGREETIAALVWLGAAPGAVEDPTSKSPEGQTAADLASRRGHKGIAGYLAEAALTSHLSSLTLTESVIDSVSATIAAEKAIESVQEQSIIPLDGYKGEQLSLRGSLAAVRNSAQAAARIRAAFRAHSFRQRQLTKDYGENNDVVDNALVLSSLSSKVHRIGHFNDSLHTAAVKIQQKYRGWKGRREFLKIRDRIVKIQAHVRGHQVRKQYKKVVWSVGIVEKAILRWRRKRPGLRGFRTEKTTGSVDQDAGKPDEYDFLRLGRKQKGAAVEKALARVQSMVRYPEARDQYMRLVARYHKSKLATEDSPSSRVPQPEEEKKAADELVAPMFE